MSGFGEFEFIAELLAPLSAEGAFGLTDDAAVLPSLKHGEAWCVTKDAMTMGVHFRPEDDADLIARKLMRTNISDLAAMGARPVGYFLALALDGRRDRDWLRRFCEGLAQDQAEFGVALYGGDTTSNPALVTMSLTAFGALPRGQELRRNGARPGDNVWVTGTIGDSALGLEVLKAPDTFPEEHGEWLTSRYWLPQPRPAFGQALRGQATSCLDISDGLLADLGHVAKHSGVAIEIDHDAVPLSEAAQAILTQHPDLALLPFTGGDDYELAFTLPEGIEPPEHGDLRCTRIGRVTDGEGVRLIRHGEIVSTDKAGWRHF